MHFMDTAKYIFIKFFGYLCIFCGLVIGYDVIQGIDEPHFFVVINGVKRADLEAKMLSLALPVLFIFVGFMLSLLRKKDVEAISNARQKFWSIFKN